MSSLAVCMLWMCLLCCSMKNQVRSAKKKGKPWTAVSGFWLISRVQHNFSLGLLGISTH